ncbi:uncharacterized protein LOC129759643 [Uranotaenia lowii]|uniref:uncharacterized protein LOC129759643 n=1 Tax=Uranotaenia lowii TaxID=190385 RepID=UPI00247834C6|nr:uncharacterized protein LOC129759643 [Uranotaenia lowii]
MLARRPTQVLAGLVRSFSNVSLGKPSAVNSTLPISLVARKTTEPSSSVTALKFLPQSISLDIGQPRISPLIPRKEIIDIPLIDRIIENPLHSRITEIGDAVQQKHTNMDLPTSSGKVDDNGIQCARLIVIRRRKMRKHKLKKLRKKMKFLWAKVRQRRELRKEKAFQAGLIAQIKDAERFSAEAYVADKLRLATETPIPRFWKGKRLPQFIIRQKLGLQ